MKINELETYLENVLEIIFDVQVCIYNAEYQDLLENLKMNKIQSGKS